MKAGNRLLIALPLLLLAGGVLTSSQGPQKPKTVWDGVYTEAQATRATGVFGASCAGCHTLTPDGNRPLSGETFWQSNTQKSVAELLAYVSRNMPNGNGGSLSPENYNDLVALILKSNGFPAGKSELTAASVEGVQIISKDGPGELPANTLVRVVGCLAKSGNEWTLTSATAPVRTDKTAATPEDGTVALGTRTMALKFVLTKLDSFVGKRMSVSGMLIGAGGADGLNVAVVNRVADTCP
jgi:S-disulfanyl-L-cysteine oxidoreductase SoxD